MKFPERLQALRKEKGYSQEKLADLLNVSRQSVSKWESGQSYPEIDKLIVLSDLFNITLGELVKGKSPEDIKSLDDEMDKEDANDEEDEDDFEDYLLLGGFLIGTFLGFVTKNFLLAAMGGFLGLGLGYVIKGIRGINKSK